MAHIAMVLHLVNHLLGMFNTHTQGKGFRFQPDVPAVQHLINIPGRMPRSQDHPGGMDRFSVFELHTLYTILFHQQIGYLRLETHFSSRSDDLLAHGDNDLRQLIGSYVRTGIHHNIRIGAEVHEYA